MKCKFIGRYADGEELVVGGLSESECMNELDKLQEKHGTILWVRDVSDVTYEPTESTGENKSAGERFQGVRFAFLLVSSLVGALPTFILLEQKATIMGFNDGVVLLLALFAIIWPVISISVAFAIAKRIDPELKAAEQEMAQTKPKNKRIRKRVVILSFLVIVSLVIDCVAVYFEWDCATVFVLIFAFLAGMLWKAISADNGDDKGA